MDEQVEAEKGWLLCPRSHSKRHGRTRPQFPEVCSSFSSMLLLGAVEGTKWVLVQRVAQQGERRGSQRSGTPPCSLTEQWCGSSGCCRTLGSSAKPRIHMPTKSAASRVWRSGTALFPCSSALSWVLHAVVWWESLQKTLHEVGGGKQR